MSPAKRLPPHPGEILNSVFLVGWEIGPRELARDLEEPSHRIAEIIAGTRPITDDMALKLGPYFNTSAHFWMIIQAEYDLGSKRELLSG